MEATWKATVRKRPRGGETFQRLDDEGGDGRAPKVRPDEFGLLSGGLMQPYSSLEAACPAA